MNKKKILTLLLSLSLCLSLSPVVGASAAETTSKDTTTVIADSQGEMYLDASAEKKAFEKKYGKSKVKLDVNKPVVISFDDGTKVEYSIKVKEDKNATELNPENLMTTASTIRTLSVSKKYLGGLFNNTIVSCNARCSFGYRSVQITDVWASSDRDALENVASKIEGAYGDNYSNASCYTRGTVVRKSSTGFGDIRANFFLHMEVDAAGAAYLMSDSY